MSAIEREDLEERRARLERRANVLRSRLLRTIDAIDVRRHQIFDVGRRARRLAAPVAGAAFAFALLAVGMTVLVSRAVEARRARRLDLRVSRFVHRLRREPRPSALEDAMRKVALTVLGIVANEVAKRVTRNVLDGRTATGRLLPLGGPQVSVRQQ